MVLSLVVANASELILLGSDEIFTRGKCYFIIKLININFVCRAVYRDADIYLLDDPLCAADIAVGQHLFENCINGLLKDKTRILVTHHLQYLEEANRIILMKNVRVVEMEFFMKYYIKINIISTYVFQLQIGAHRIPGKF